MKTKTHYYDKFRRGWYHLVDKDYVHETHYENEDPYGNLEF